MSYTTLPSPACPTDQQLEHKQIASFATHLMRMYLRLESSFNFESMTCGNLGSECFSINVPPKRKSSHQEVPSQATEGSDLTGSEGKKKVGTRQCSKQTVKIICPSVPTDICKQPYLEPDGESQRKPKLRNWSKLLHVGITHGSSSEDGGCWR